MDKAGVHACKTARNGGERRMTVTYEEAWPICCAYALRTMRRGCLSTSRDTWCVTRVHGKLVVVLARPRETGGVSVVWVNASRTSLRSPIGRRFVRESLREAMNAATNGGMA